MSVEYFYENDLNMLYNAAVNNNPDGGEHHTKMLESYNNLVAYISHIEHWKSTALQLAKNYGVRIHSLEQRIAELEQERRWISVDEIKEAGLYAFINYHNGNNVGYFTPEYLNYYQKNHVKWVYRLPQPPQEKE